MLQRSAGPAEQVQRGRENQERFHSDPPREYKYISQKQGLSKLKECIKKFGGKADEASPKTSPLSG